MHNWSKYRDTECELFQYGIRWLIGTTDVPLCVMTLHGDADVMPQLRFSEQKSGVYRACKSRARKRGWGQLGAGDP